MSNDEIVTKQETAESNPSASTQAPPATRPSPLWILLPILLIALAIYFAR